MLYVKHNVPVRFKMYSSLLFHGISGYQTYHRFKNLWEFWDIGKILQV